MKLVLSLVIMAICSNVLADPISLQDAKGIVEQFEGGTVCFKDQYDNSDGVYWLYECDPGSKSWAVGDDGVSYFTMSNPEWKMNPFGNEPVGYYSKQECESFAVSYASAKCPFYPNHNMQISRSVWTGYGWDVHINEVLTTGAKTNTIILISINPKSGNIFEYTAQYSGFQSPVHPLISENDAVSLAALDLNLTTVTSIDENQLLQSEGRLVYLIIIWGYDMSGDSVGPVKVLINAVTGDVEDRAYTAGKHPQKWTSIPEAAFKYSEIELNKGEDGAYLLTKENIRLSFRIGDSFITDSKGEKIELAGKIEEKDGEFIVPADFLPTVAKHIGKNMEKKDESKEKGSEDSEDGTSVGMMDGGAASGPFYYIAGTVLAGVLLGVVVKSRIAASRKRNLV